MSPTVLGPVPDTLRNRACRVLDHVKIAGETSCPIPDADLVDALCDRVEALERELRLAHSREESR